MKKLSLLLATLILAGCSSQNILPQIVNDVQIQNTASQSTTLTAKKAYTIALKEVKKLLKSPKLFEVDVWKEANSDTIDFGFMQKEADGSYKSIRIIIDRQTNKVTNEVINDGKTPNPVNLSHWKMDSEAILKIAQDKGLQDPTYLITLWEDTWHISGLKQNLYFQMDSQDGKIKMICTDPYLTQCTDGEDNPISKELSLKLKNKLKEKNKFF